MRRFSHRPGQERINMPANPAVTHIAKTLVYTSPLLSCRFDPTGKYVFAGAEDFKVVRWELATGTKVELAGHDSWVRGLAFSANGENLVTGGNDGRLIWWAAGADMPVPIRTIQAHQGWIRAIAVSPDRRLLASCGNDHKVKLWSLADGSPVREFLGHERHVYNVAFHPDGKHLVSGDIERLQCLCWRWKPHRIANRLGGGKRSHRPSQQGRNSGDDLGTDAAPRRVLDRSDWWPRWRSSVLLEARSEGRVPLIESRQHGSRHVPTPRWTSNRDGAF